MYRTCKVGKYLYLFLLFSLDIPNLKLNNIHYGKHAFYYVANLQATRIQFSSFSNLDARDLESYISRVMKTSPHDYYFTESDEEE